MSKRILLLTRYFPPLDSIASVRLHSWAKYLQKAGHQVSVLTTSKKGQVVNPLDLDCSAFDVDELDYFDPICAAGFRKADSNNSESSPWKKRLAGFYRSRMNERLPGRTDPWILPARRELKRRWKEGLSYDCIISSYGPPAAHIVGAYAKQLFGCRWIADYRDLWLENATYSGLWPFTLLEAALEKRLVGRAEVITTVSEPYCDFLQKKFPQAQVSCIYNGFDSDLGQQVSKDAFSGLKPKFRMVYTGSLYARTRNPEPLLAALRQLLDTAQVQSGEIELLFYGSCMDGLDDLIEKYQLEAVVTQGGSVGQTEAQRLQVSADALLLVEQSNPKVDGILTGKLFEYLYARRPILGIGYRKDSAAGKLITEARAGISCGDNVPLIAQTLLEMMRGGSPFHPAEEVIMRYSREQQAKGLLAIL